ncbi:hypothetical protein U2F10_14325 [Leptothoe sp. EHU-05/26/07-4]
MKLRVLLGAAMLLMTLVFVVEALPSGKLQMTQDSIQTLNQMGLLSEATYQELRAALAQGYDKSRAAILQRMADDLSQRSLGGYRLDLGVESGYADILMSVAEVEQLRHLMDRLNATEGPSEDDLQQLQSFFEQLTARQNSHVNDLEERLYHLLNQLNSAGLLTERVYRQLHSQIDSEEIASELALHQQAASWMSLDEQLSAEILAPELENFNAAEILSEENHTKLTEALRQEEIAHPIQFLNYYNRALLIDLRSYSKQPEDYLLAIYNAVAEMLLENDVVDTPIDNFEVQLEVNEESRVILEAYRRLAESSEHGDRYRLLANDDSLYYDAILSAKVNDRTYYQRNFYGGNPEGPNDSYRVTPEDITKLFNKVLYDQASPYRVYSVSNFGPTFGDSTELANQLGFIALTKAQADIYFDHGFEANHSPLQFTSDRIDEILDLFEQIDLLDHLSPDQIEASRKLIAESYITQRYELFSAFKDVILLFEWESGNVDTPYQSLTENFAAISRGQFSPTEISNEFDWESQTAAQTFILNGTQYHTPLEFNGDWLDPNFFSFIQSVADQEISTGQFYAVDVGYDTPGYLFLTPVQLEVLRSENLIQLTTSNR